MFSPVNIRRDDICFAFCLAGSRVLRGSSSAEVTHGALWARIGGDMDGGVSDTSASRAKRGEGGARLGGAEMPAGRVRLESWRRKGKAYGASSPAKAHRDPALVL